MAITYYSNIPQTNDDPSQSQPLLLANFQGIDTLIDINHAAFASADAGKHTLLTMTNQATPSNPPTDQLNVYNKVPAGGNDKVTLATQELFLQRNAANSQYPFTAGSSQFTFLPSGLLIKWGSVSVTGFNQTITFPTGAAIPAFTAAPYAIQLSVASPTNNAAGANKGVALATTASTATTFAVNAFQLSDRAATAVTVRWVAIGTGV